MTDLHFLAVGPYCWGTGRSIEEAVNNAKRNWPRAFVYVKRPQYTHFSLYCASEPVGLDPFTANIVSEAKDLLKIQTSSLAAKG